MGNPFIIPDCPDPLWDVPFSFGREYKVRIDERVRQFQPSAEMLSASPVMIHVPGAPEAVSHYAVDGTKLQVSSDRTILAPGKIPEDGRYCSEIGSAHIEAFLKKGTRDYLYVFPDGARTRNQGRDLAPLPSFLRWSWYRLTSASLLCLEDPMFYTYSDLKLGWFYGTRDEDYTEYCALLVRHIADLLSIPPSHIIFYGPSGGGHAAICMSAFIPGSTAVSVNGQYDISLHSYYREGHFTRITGMSAADPCGLVRNRSAEIILEHPENHFLLINNIQSKQDFEEQLKCLCGRLNVTPRYGLQTNGNLTVWIFDAKGIPSTHSTFETPVLFRMIDILLLNLINGAKAQDFPQYCELISQYWKEQYDLLHKISKLENDLKNPAKARLKGRLSGILNLPWRIARKLRSIIRSIAKPER